MQFLALDRGNSLLKATVLERTPERRVRVLAHTVIEGEDVVKEVGRIASMMVSTSEITGGMYCGVGPENGEYERLRENLATKGIMLERLDSSTPLPISNHYHTPATLGMDRIAALCGAATLYPATSLVVADAGTALTLDILSSTSEGEMVFEGGNISAGVTMRLRALNAYTDKLPLVSHEELEKHIGDHIGTDTLSALSCGALTGVATEILSAFRYAKSRYCATAIIATGGDSRLLSKELQDLAEREGTETTIKEEPDLLAIGLMRIYEHKHQK
ncbi:MAG: type III pantothenate kinase [Clostridium sp.]|nr:type III pantothenate kinase [Prevotella sp.]MCM1428422.1 type III pantothenate kinase [Clostridium sp.]MCM1474887.1 type III pantothenate kinase [Muribaculaceae bacterium]